MSVLYLSHLSLSLFLLISPSFACDWCTMGVTSLCVGVLLVALAVCGQAQHPASRHAGHWTAAPTMASDEVSRKRGKNRKAKCNTQSIRPQRLKSHLVDHDPQERKPQQNKHIQRGNEGESFMLMEGKTSTQVICGRIGGDRGICR